MKRMSRPHLRWSDYDNNGDILPDGYKRLKDGSIVDITEEQAIDKLHETGWLIRHDKEMTERPTGKWEDYSVSFYKCPECGYLLEKDCPRCQTKVILPKGGEEEKC